MTPSSLERSPKESLSLYLGLGKSRKTTLALDDMAGESFVVVCSEMNHPDIEALDNVTDSAGGLSVAQRLDQSFTLLVMNDNPALFEFLSETRKTILFDDGAFFNYNEYLTKPFKLWVRHIRHRKQRVLLTTHRAKDDLPPIIYFYARRIHQVGPLYDQGEAKNLFEKRTVNIDFSEFYEHLKTMEIYDNTRGNEAKSIYTIKSL